MLNILSRLGFFFYWIFDNLQILSKVKFLEGVDKEKAGKRAAFFWLIGLLFSIAAVAVEMLEVAKEEAQLKADYRSQHEDMDDRKASVMKEKRDALSKRKFDNTLNLLKNLGDLLTATQALSIPKSLFGFDLK